MTKIQSTFQLTAALLCMAYMASAQTTRSCDVTMNIEAPVDSSIIAIGDTVYLNYTITNHGPDPILASDTLWFWLQVEENVKMFKALSDIPKDSTKYFTYGYRFSNTGELETNDTMQWCAKLLTPSSINVSYPQVAWPVGGVWDDPDTMNNLDCVTIILEGTESSDIATIPNEREILQIYPNPAIDEVSIAFKLNKREDVTISVTDIRGREVTRRVYEQVLPNEHNPLKFNVSTFPKGMYFLELQTKTRKSSGKLLIQR